MWYVEGRVQEAVATLRNPEHMFRTFLCKHSFFLCPFSKFLTELQTEPLFCERVRPPTDVKIPKSGEEGFGVKKIPFAITSEKGVLSRKIPIFLVEPCREMGIFQLKTPFSDVMGNGSF